MVRQLTALRWFAALAVLCTHVLVRDDANHPAVRWAYTHLLNQGHLGVGFFYMLSGLILAHVYGALRREGWGTFWRARFARVYPLHLLFLVIAVAAPALQALQGAGSDFLLQVFLMQAWSPKTTAFTYNAVAWSLSCEAFFYLCFPVLLPRVARLDAARARQVIVGLLLLILLAPAVVPASEHHRLLYLLPATRLLEFAIGMLLTRVVAPRDAGDADVVKGGTAREVGAGLLVLTLMVAGAALAARGYEGVTYVAWYAPALTWLLAVYAQGAGRVSRALSRPGWVYLGEVSFAVYMAHFMTAVGIDHFTDLQGDGRAAVTFMVTMLISVAAHHLVELPGRRVLRAPVNPAAQATTAERPSRSARNAQPRERPQRDAL